VNREKETQFQKKYLMAGKGRPNVGNLCGGINCFYATVSWAK
jgi:predicted flavoprotein YhiN